VQASELPLSHWHPSIKPSEFPDGVLEHMCAHLLTNGLFPLRTLSGVPMSPSSLYGAHVRHDNGRSRHCTHNKTRLSTATDFHVKDHQHLLKVFDTAQRIPAIGGIGLYFDTNRPMVHIDTRKDKLAWVRYQVDGKERYVYRENNAVVFYQTLGGLL
jgi:hypothetical protein